MWLVNALSWLFSILNRRAASLQFLFEQLFEFRLVKNHTSMVKFRKFEKNHGYFSKNFHKMSFFFLKKRSCSPKKNRVANHLFQVKRAHWESNLFICWNEKKKMSPKGESREQQSKFVSPSSWWCVSKFFLYICSCLFKLKIKWDKAIAMFLKWNRVTARQ